MDAIPQALQQLIAAFGRLPGIGRKTATRLAFHILKNTKEESEELAQAILKVKNDIVLCSQCFNFTEEDPCYICRDEDRNRKIICVVEDPENITLIEKTNEYKGLYHVLGGIISPLDGIGPEDLRIKELLSCLAGVEEVIFTLDLSSEGKATAS